jgi:hypothetical protein
MPREKVQADCLVVVLKRAVIAVERRGQVTAVDMGQPVRWDEPLVQRKAAAFVRWHEPDDARVSSPESVSGSG